MARKRFVSPKFFKHGELYDAEVSYGLPLRLGFEGLWCQADRRGYFHWKPRELKTDCLPYDPCDFGDVLNALESRGFVVSYVVAGKKYGRIPSFLDHQSFHKDEKPDPTIPEPPAEGAQVVPAPEPEGTSTTKARCEHSAGTVPAPPKHRASTPIAVAVTSTTTTPVAVAVGDPAPGKPEVPPGPHPPTPRLHSTDHEPPYEPPPSVSRGMHGQYAQICAGALPYQRACLNYLIERAPVPDAVVGIVNAIITEMHPVRNRHGDTARPEHVLMAVAESALKFFANGKVFDKRLFEGCVLTVLNRAPTPTAADERAIETELRKSSVPLRFEAPTTPKDEAEALRLRRAKLRAMWIDLGKPDKAKQYEDPPANGAAA